MRYDLRFAGLEPVLEQRLRLAANALAAHRLQAKASPWDGTRCDIVVVDAKDAYGRRTMEIAQKRSTPVLDIHATIQSVEQEMTVAQLTRSLLELLQRPNSGMQSPVKLNGYVAKSANACGLVQFATVEGIQSENVEARSGETRIWLLPEIGRVVSTTVGDQLKARERFATATDWSITPLEGQGEMKISGGISASLDAFLLSAAWSGRAELPPFPAGGVTLQDWPDLGTASTLVEALAVAQALQRGPTTVAHISKETQVTEIDIGACLWAFKAAGLLIVSAPPAEVSKQSPQRSGGLFSRLAAHFGLVQS
jgi:hypothetical protein